MIDWLRDFWVGMEASVNPYSEQQMTLFFVWLVVFVTASVTVIIAERRWLRFLAWLVCTLSSFGLWQAQLISIAIAVNYWPSALAVAGGTAAGSYWIGRRRQ